MSLSVCSHISKTTRPNITIFSVRVTCLVEFARCGTGRSLMSTIALFERIVTVTEFDQKYPREEPR